MYSGVSPHLSSSAVDAMFTFRNKDMDNEMTSGEESFYKSVNKKWNNFYGIALAVIYLMTMISVTIT